jgi:hypothetical protein
MIGLPLGDFVVHGGARFDEDGLAGAAAAEAEVAVFVVHKQALVEEADLCEGGARDQHAAAGDEVDGEGRGFQV